MSLRDLEELGHLTIPKIRSLKVRPYPFSKISPWCIRGASSRFLIILGHGLRRTQAVPALSGRKLSSPCTMRLRRLEQTQVSRNGHRTDYGTALPPITWRSFRTLPRTALDLGHVSRRTVFNHYREVVMPQEAERYWKIFPAKKAQNVVPMTACC